MASAKFNKKHLFWIIPTSILTLILLLFLLYPILTKSYIKKNISEIALQNHWEIKYAKLHFKKYKDLSISDFLILTKANHDTILFLKNLNIELGYGKSHFLKPYAINFQIDELLFKSIASENSTANADFENENSESISPNYFSSQLMTIIRSLKQYTPENLNIQKMRIIHQKEDQISEYQINDLHIMGELFTGEIIFSENGERSPWKLDGNISLDRSKMETYLRYIGHDPHPHSLFIFPKSRETSIAFRELFLSYHLIEDESNTMKIRFNSSIKELHFMQSSVVEEEIVLRECTFDCLTEITPQRILIDSSSFVKMNDFPIPFSLLVEEYSNKRFRLQIPEYLFNYETFQTALPPTLFRIIPSLELKGNIAFSLIFDCDFGNPEKLIFDFDISAKNLQFSDSARHFFTRYNQDFHYNYIENDTIVKDIWVSPANTNFVTYENIPFYLKYAILAAEDPSFFRHNGFLKSAMKEAMVVNLEREKFSRGGSTLSMQFVKNLFLTKKKNLSRKIEEIFLVWLIEDYKLISKERMFEIYVNIIEWAPHVYGLGEASEFYFNTSPDRLGFGECVFLSTLIRAPKQYAKSLSPEGYPVNERREEMHIIARRMFERGLINEYQYNTFNSYIQTAIIRE